MYSNCIMNTVAYLWAWRTDGVNLFAEIFEQVEKIWIWLSWHPELPSICATLVTKHKVRRNRSAVIRIKEYLINVNFSLYMGVRRTVSSTKKPFRYDSHDITCNSTTIPCVSCFLFLYHNIFMFNDWGYSTNKYGHPQSSISHIPISYSRAYN